MLPKIRHNRPLEQWKDPHATLHGLFREIAQLYPERLALVDGDRTWSYERLDRESDQLAAALIAQGVVPGDVVGIYLDKCGDYILACLAILKTGAAYLPFELAYPKDLLAQIVAQAMPRLILTFASLLKKLPQTRPAVCCLDIIKLPVKPERLDIPLMADAPAIVGYSSGSTGQPKGIVVSHRACLYAYCLLWQDVRHLTSIDRFGYTSFVAWDAVNPLCMGATGVLISDQDTLDPRLLIERFAQFGINHTVLTPSLLGLLVDTVDQETLRRCGTQLTALWVGGEVMSPELATRTLAIWPHLTLLNTYGPAECFVIAQGILTVANTQGLAACPVGRVLDGMDICLLDEQGQAVPSGQSGELFAHGPCLADGYLKNPALTAERFVFRQGKRYFRTGDLAHCLPDGQLVIQGRQDYVVKLRGYHVNLKAIEAVLRTLPQIQDAVVVQRDEQLIAYCVNATPKPSGHDENLIAALKSQLPWYMIPTVFVPLRHIPLHPASKKVDFKRLPAPTKHLNVAKEQPTFAGNEVENALRRLISHILKLDPNVITDTTSLRDLGMNSLSVVRLAHQIEDRFGQPVTVAEIIEADHLTGLTRLLQSAQALPDVSVQHLRDDAAQLAQDLVMSDLPSPAVKPITAILLTGATGFLGTFVLDALLTLFPNATVICPVRTGSKTETAKERLFAQLHQHLGRLPESVARIQALQAEISQPNLGLPANQYQSLAATVGLVIHVAASVNLAYPYSALREANVIATKEMLRFASTLHAKPFVQVSTIGIFGLCDKAQEDQDINPLITGLEDGYSQSKWVAEYLVHAAGKRGLPVAIIRPGNIGPDQITGRYRQDDFFSLLLHSCLELDWAPDGTDWLFETTHVNLVAEIIAHIAARFPASIGTYHITNPEPCPASMVFKHFVATDKLSGMLPLTEWQQRLRQAVNTQKESDRMQRLLAILEQEATVMADKQQVASGRCTAFMKLAGLSRHRLTPAYFASYLTNG